ncbi:AzlC family ABC transporter permease [Calderihabitans maritimus]|uniref:AzlC-like protein n=1 Tax=Calderihabitans maritimus TaxID=1246530 RepID=A0A1Z5HWA1_9FIRM|nr:AzlC family ABC transporter permease [Calderihabitans maritimus]GAW93611.1 AzlC-like protein [Calderihabitans maritimus]
MQRSEFVAGVHSAIPIVLGYLPLGFAYGVLARQAGLSLAETVIMSVLVYAGSGQFIAVSLLGAGAPVLPIVFTVFLVNLRHLLMSASLVPYVGHYSRKLLAAISYQITDETYAVAISHFQKVPAREAYHLGLNLTAHSSWIFASFLGGTVGSMVQNPARWGLDFALPAMFIALLVGQINNRLTLIVALVGGISALGLALLLPGNWYIILGTITAATSGVMLEKWIKK